MLPPPPPSQLSPPRPRQRRRWPWLAVALAVCLLAAGTAFVLVRRDGASASAGRDLQERLDDLLAGSTAPGSDAPSGGNEDQPETTTTNPLEELLRGLTGGKGLEDLQKQLQDLLGGAGSGSGDAGGLGANVDPSCLLGDAGANGLGGLGGGGVQGTVAEQVTKIAALVEQERGLRFEHPVEPELLDADAFDRRVADQVATDYPAEQADLDSRVLQLLGAVPKGTDLKAMEQDLLSGQVAGYYDPETGKIVVRVPKGTDSLGAADQITLAHELDHALTDQVLGLPDTDAKGQTDADLAALALVEGDATLLMERFGLRNVGLLDQLGSALGPEAGQAQQDLAKYPSYLRDQLMYPYTAGLAYTCRLQQGKGWPGVDAAYKDLPRSTAEVLFADREGTDPVDARDVTALGGPWKDAQRDTFGAAQLLWLFHAPGGDDGAALDNADAAAERWAGGEVALFTDGGRSALGLALVDNGDGGELCRAVQDWYAKAFDTGAVEDGGRTVLEGGGQVGALSCDGRDVRLGIAPDQATAVALAH